MGCTEERSDVPEASSRVSSSANKRARSGLDLVPSSTLLPPFLRALSLSLFLSFFLIIAAFQWSF